MVLFTSGVAMFEAYGKVVESSSIVSRLGGLTEEVDALLAIAWVAIELDGTEEVHASFVTVRSGLDIVRLCHFSISLDQGVEQARFLVFIAPGLVDVSQLSDGLGHTCLCSLLEESESDLVIVSDVH